MFITHTHTHITHAQPFQWPLYSFICYSWSSCSVLQRIFGGCWNGILWWLLGLVVTRCRWSWSTVVALRRARLVLGWVTIRGYTIFILNQSHPGLLRLAIPPWVGTMSTRSPLRKKRWLLHNSDPVPGLLAYWHSWLKALVAMGPAIRLTCHNLA